jgi:hypothetical protein
MSDPGPIVFVVDDDLSIRDALTSLIRSVGLGVETFGSAREFLTRQPPDAPGRWMCAWWRRPIESWRRWWTPGTSAPISTTA